MKRYIVGDKVKGIAGDIVGCEGFISSVSQNGYQIYLTKLGKEDWHGVKDEWKIGNTVNRGIFWEGCLKKIGHNNKFNHQKPQEEKLILNPRFKENSIILIEKKYQEAIENGSFWLAKQYRKELKSMVNFKI